MLAILVSLLRSRLTGHALAWLETELDAIASGCSADHVHTSYTAAARQAGRVPLKLTADESQRVSAVDADVCLTHWTTDDAARASLLLASANAMPDHFQDIATVCYDQGSSREQQSWLRSLPLFSQPVRFLSTAIDASRTSFAALLESIACENPYPARYFPERNFNQLVLNVLSSGIALTRIVGLSSRLNAELARMAADYAGTRKQAGRQVPKDIVVLIERLGIRNSELGIGMHGLEKPNS